MVPLFRFRDHAPPLAFLVPASERESIVFLLAIQLAPKNLCGAGRWKTFLVFGEAGGGRETLTGRVHENEPGRALGGIRLPKQKSGSSSEVLQRDQRNAGRGRPLSGSGIIFCGVLRSEKQLNILAPYRQKAVQLSAQGDRRDAPFLPIIDILSVTNFCAPFAVKRKSENRLQFGLDNCIAQEVLIEESVLPLAMIDDRADCGT
jgi:hypothetical protein